MIMKNMKMKNFLKKKKKINMKKNVKMIILKMKKK